MCIVIRHRLDVVGIMDTFPVGTRDLSPLQRVETDSGVHPFSCSVFIGILSPGANSSGNEGEQSFPCIPEVKNEWVFTSIRTRLHRVVLN